MSIEDRLKRHNSGPKDFTGRADDWRCVYKHSLDTIQESRKLEKRVKARGAKRYLEDPLAPT